MQVLGWRCTLTSYQGATRQSGVVAFYYFGQIILSHEEGDRMCEHCFQVLAMHPGYQELRYLLWVENFDTMRDGGRGGVECMDIPFR